MTETRRRVVLITPTVEVGKDISRRPVIIPLRITLDPHLVTFRRQGGRREPLRKLRAHFYVRQQTQG